MAKLILLFHAGATLGMFGMIWFVQLVHYPLFGRVGAERFTAYQAEHEWRTLWIIVVLMPAEGITGFLLLWRRPEGVTAAQVWLGLALLGVIWASTAFVQIPQHRRLRAGFDAEAHRRLVVSNWLRTAAWTERAVLVLWMAARAMG